MVSVYPFGKLTIIRGNPGEGRDLLCAMRLAAACTNQAFTGMETLGLSISSTRPQRTVLGDTIQPRLMEADADAKVLVIETHHR